MTVLAPESLSGRRAIVTGGGTGIGRATALLLSSLGAEVVVTGRREELLDETVAAASGPMHAVTADVREPDQVDALLDRTGELLGRVDVLVNNAGGQFVAPAEEISLKGFRAVTRLNLDAVFDLTTKVANRWLIPDGGGAIVSVVISPRRGRPGMAHSAAARAGVESLTRTLSLEWARHGIRINAVAPGIIETEIIAKYGIPPELIAAQVPAGRLGTAEEVAESIAWLVSPGAAYVTGTTLVVDGGLDLAMPGVELGR